MSGAKWFEAQVPGTAAGALAAASAWSFDSPRDFDADDWWFRCPIIVTDRQTSEKTVLRLGGLATLAEVWLDGEHILRSENMFLEHEIDIGGRLHPESEIVIRFASLGDELKKKRPRPRWRSMIVAQQQLRWVRTTLLGRIPAWAPPVAPVGPYRGVSLERRSLLAAVSGDVKTRVAGREGAVDVALRVAAVGGGKVEAVSFRVGLERTELTCHAEPDGAVVARGSLTLRDVRLWWPFSHGSPALYDVAALVRTDRGGVKVNLGRTGFRSVELDRSGGGFAIRVNGVDVFCRGAVWTPLDVVGLTSSVADLRAALEAARAAGMNMLRVSGTMLYESQSFYDLCDELGILVWQDFMFANMDYPVTDATFAQSASTEAAQLLDRLQLSPSLAVVCGNTEVAQQAAMLGLAEDEWSSPLFTDLLPAVVRAARPDVPYCATTPDGGGIPFRADVGVSHFYGVGAYLRPVEDARRARVRFAAECLAFANIPSDETIESLMTEGDMPTNHPRWKARVPRDKATGWDFDDVRDHYLHSLFGLDPALLRRTDPGRYLELGRVVTGETMLATLAEWRRAGSECRGALVWLLRDFWTGAGWGVIDALGRPKAAYYFLKRAFSPVALVAIDEGMNGLSLHAINDGPEAINAELRLVLYRLGEIPVAEGTAPVSIAAHGATEVTADALLGRFVDTTYAYRFGPPNHDLVVASLVDSTNRERIGQAFFFPCGYLPQRFCDLGVEAFAERSAPGEWRVTVRTKKFAQAVSFDARGFVADDDFFHIEPGGERVVTLRGSGAALSARVSPLNAAASTKVVVRGQSSNV
jgi:beta-mannosidase